MLEIKAALIEFCKTHQVFVSRVAIDGIDTISITKNDSSGEINLLFADDKEIIEYSREEKEVNGEQIVMF